jgi:hypothetical protein
MGGSAQADSVTFTAEVPNGTLNFEGLVGFSVWNADNASPNFETDLSPGMTGNGVVTSMNLDLNAFANAFSGDGTVSGADLEVNTANNGWFSDPAEVSMSMSVDVTPGGSILPDFMPTYPFLPADYEPPPCIICSGGYGVMALFLGDENGRSVPAGGAGAAVATVGFEVGASMTEYSATVGFSAFDTTEQMLETLDATFSSFSLPAGAAYHGLIAGVPTFTTDRVVDMSVGISVLSSAELNFLTGAFIAYQVPEPATVVLLSLALPLTLLSRRKAALRR